LTPAGRGDYFTIPEVPFLPRVEFVVGDGAPEGGLAVHDGLGVAVGRRRWRR
jgi:hypothetical protein